MVCVVIRCSGRTCKGTLLAAMPGVKADDFNVDLRDDTLTLAVDVGAGVTTPGEKIYREYETGRYYH